MKSKETITKKLSKLDDIVKYFEDTNKDFDLDLGLTQYDEAMEIVRSLKKELQSYELKIQEIKIKYNTEAGTDD